MNVKINMKNTRRLFVLLLSVILCFTVISTNTFAASQEENYEEESSESSLIEENSEISESSIEESSLIDESSESSIEENSEISESSIEDENDITVYEVKAGETPVTSETDVINALNSAQFGDEFIFVIQNPLTAFSGSNDGQEKMIIPDGVTVTFKNAPSVNALVVRSYDLFGIPFSPMIEVNGTLIIEEDTSGGGSLTFSGANENFYDAPMFKVTGSMQMRSGTITKAMAIDGGAIYGEENSTVEISGGLLTENTAKRINNDTGLGGAVFSKGDVTISGGEISLNNANQGGGVYVKGNLTISGGMVKENKSENSGAGVAYDDKSKNNTLLITGGEFIDNKASGMFGGGLNVIAGMGEIIGGDFSGNKSLMMGGGIFIADGAEVSMTRVVIYDNNAGTQGGGVYNCPTGGGNYRKYRGLTLYNNRAYTNGGASEGGDDFFSEEEKASGIVKNIVYLSDYTLNASKINWYKDEGGNRYAEGNEAADSSYYQNTDELIALKSGASQSDFDESLAIATVFIHNNTSMIGAGITNNGIVDVGYKTALQIKKNVLGTPNGAENTFTFKITLTDESGAPYAGNIVYEYNNAESELTFDENGQASLTLNSDETVILFNIPQGTHYTAEEVPVNGFVLTESKGTSGVIDENTENTAEFTNTYEPAPTEEPTPTEEPAPTEEPIPTKEPTPTEEPIPTEEPMPTEMPTPNPSQTAKPNNPTGTNSPQTGDSTNVLLWTLTFLGAAVGVCAIVKNRNRY